MTQPHENMIPQDDFETENQVLDEATPSWFSRTYGDEDQIGRAHV